MLCTVSIEFQECLSVTDHLKTTVEQMYVVRGNNTVLDKVKKVDKETVCVGRVSLDGGTGEFNESSSIIPR